MFYVIDAGVAVKWFIPEVDSDIAHQLLARYLQGVDTPIVRISSSPNVGMSSGDAVVKGISRPTKRRRASPTY